MWETSHPLSFAVAGYALAASIMPNLVLIAAGHLVGSIPAASAAGLGSAAGHRLVFALAVTGALYAAALVLGPVQSSLSSVVKWRLVYRTEDRLIAAVSGPVGIAHLEDPKVLDDLALAQGQLTGQMPADAPMTLALVVSNRVSGLFACRRARVVAVVAGAGDVRHVDGHPAPAAGPDPGAGGAVRGGFGAAAAGLVPAAAGGHAGRGQGVEGVRAGRVAGGPVPVDVSDGDGRPVGGAAAAGPRGAFLSLPVLLAFGVSCGYLGLAAYRGEIGLGTLAVMLPMLAATTPLGDISWDDVALSWMMQGLPRARELETALLASPS